MSMKCKKKKIMSAEEERHDITVTHAKEIREVAADLVAQDKSLNYTAALKMADEIVRRAERTKKLREGKL